MNISPRSLLNNGISEEKKNFYENLASRYSKISHDYNKKTAHEHANFSKKVLNWFFSQSEETRMLLCSVENKKYTNTIYEAYTYMLKHKNGVKFRFMEEEEEKYKIKSITDDYNKYFLQSDYNYNKYSSYNNDYYYNKNPYLNNNNKTLKELKNQDKEFLRNIIFYQSESPIEDKKNYNSYFTLDKSFLKNEELFKHCCNALSYNSFLSAPIIIKKDVQNKTIYSFELPVWINKEIKEVNQKQNYNYEEEDNYSYNNGEMSNCSYYSLSQYCLAFIEQALCIRYVIYNKNKNMKEILSSIYLTDLLSKKDMMLNFINSLDFNKEKFYEKFEIDEINTSLFYDETIDKFIKEKNIILNIDNICDENEQLNYLDKYKDAKINLNIFDNKDLFEGFYDLFENDIKKVNKEIINNITFFHVEDLFSYKDFSKRLIFDKIYEEYSKKICDDLIMDDEKKAKKKKKKKKKNNNENKININEIKENNEENKKYIYNFIKNYIIDKINKKLNEIQEKSNINIIKKNNKKEKEFFLYQPTKKKEKKKTNNKKNKNANSNKKENIININEDNKIDNANIEDKNEFQIENSNSSNNNIIINPETKKEYKEDLKEINITNNINNINYSNEKENNINIQSNSNNISTKNTNISINSIEIQSHINSFTVSSSANNSSTSSDSINFKINSNLYKNDIYDNNNLFVVHQNPMIISYQKFYKLTNDIINFVTDIESLLIILREIKMEIKNHFEKIIKKVYNDAKIEIYGSSLYKLDIETSDLDLSISTYKENNLEDLVSYLNNYNQDNKYLNINFISTASIPIIKLDVNFLKLNNDKINELNKKLINNDYYNLCIKNKFYNDTNIIKVDISLNSINYKQINFIEKGIKQYPQIVYLIKILKKLLMYKHMNNSYKGGMSSYCLFLIIYSYIKMYSTFYSNNSIDNNYGSILIGFLFNYVMCIDFRYTIINPLLNNPFKILNNPLETFPKIIEPTTQKNAGKNIYRIFDVVNTLNEIYRDIYIILKKDFNDDDNYVYELFKHYIENG